MEEGNLVKKKAKWSPSGNASDPEEHLSASGQLEAFLVTLPGNETLLFLIFLCLGEVEGSRS